VNYRKLLITSISPNPIDENNGFTLTVRGINFGIGSTVRWNGTDLVTTFINSTELQVEVSGDSGTYAITVFSPSPGGGTSNTVNLVIHNVAATATFPDHTIVGAKSLAVGLTGIFDPSNTDLLSLHYSYALSLEDQATSYATAQPSVTMTFAFTNMTKVYARSFDKDGARDGQLVPGQRPQQCHGGHFVRLYGDGSGCIQQRRQGLQRHGPLQQHGYEPANQPAGQLHPGQWHEHLQHHLDQGWRPDDHRDR
jgi:hypothetical protein